VVEVLLLLEELLFQGNQVQVERVQQVLSAEHLSLVREVGVEVELIPLLVQAVLVEVVQVLAVTLAHQLRLVR